jgi:transcriptional regulator with XRE-family HTH domain
MDERGLLGRRVKELRQARGLSQEQLADRMGINAKYLSSIERGKENPTLDLLFKLAKALRVETGALFNYTWQRLPEAELRKRLRTLLESADVDKLRELLVLLTLPE